MHVDPPQVEATPSLLLNYSGRLENYHTLSCYSHSTPANRYTGAAVMAYNNQYQNDDYYNNNNNNNWDARSTKSYNTQHSTYSTQHLNPQYNNAPPVPQMPYAQPVVDYPPVQQLQRPYGGAYDRAGSIASGYTSARDKLMKRRVSTHIYICPLPASGERLHPAPAPSLLHMQLQKYRC